MPTCIFCDNELTAATKPEHILLSALGGRKTSRWVICSQHNQTFGNTIDAAVADQVAVLRNQLQLESGTGNAPPGLGRRQAGDETIKINSDGTPELVGKPFTLTPLGEGRFNLHISVNSAEELSSYIPHIAAQMKTTEERVREQLMAADATVVSRRPGTVHFHTPFGGAKECKSFLKSCLVLWATLVGNVEVKSTPYRAARDEIVTAADNDQTELPSSPKVKLDSRPLPQLDMLKERYGEFFNLIYIRSDDTGRVVGHFTLYNIISWQMVLAENGGSHNRKIALIANPLDPGIWSDRIAEELDIDMSWLNSPDFEVSRSHARLSAAIGKAQHDGMMREIGRISDAVFLKYGFAGDDPITDPALTQAISSEIAHRVAYHIRGIPYTEVVSGAELLTGKSDPKGP